MTTPENDFGTVDPVDEYDSSDYDKWLAEEEERLADEYHKSPEYEEACRKDYEQYLEELAHQQCESDGEWNQLPSAYREQFKEQVPLSLEYFATREHKEPDWIIPLWLPRGNTGIMIGLVSRGLQEPV